jgi:hypothetical protein
VSNSSSGESCVTFGAEGCHKTDVGERGRWYEGAGDAGGKQGCPVSVGPVAGQPDGDSVASVGKTIGVTEGTVDSPTSASVGTNMGFTNGIKKHVLIPDQGIVRHDHWGHGRDKKNNGSVTGRCLGRHDHRVHRRDWNKHGLIPDPDIGMHDHWGHIRARKTCVQGPRMSGPSRSQAGLNGTPRMVQRAPRLGGEGAAPHSALHYPGVGPQ